MTFLNIYANFIDSRYFQSYLKIICQKRIRQWREYKIHQQITSKGGKNELRILNEFKHVPVTGLKTGYGSKTGTIFVVPAKNRFDTDSLSKKRELFNCPL